ncbi:hypothetical protein HGRIS_010538 [Hohenbuehelia grisea]|uniref:Association with the SNF1 complex (ASC) domain-containing protein n=1 Tax=Hohenbuehelia grisea TaxID=104357 RepID=A0ABR3IX98_9AGAR
MGNANSNANSLLKPRPSSSSPKPEDGKAPHKSLRQKKKSLELPDLASLGLTPAIRHPPTHSTPINIPAHTNQSDNNGTEPSQRPALPADFSAADVTAYPYPRNRTSSRTYRVRNDTRDFYAHPYRGRSGYTQTNNPVSIASALNLPPQKEEDPNQPYVEEIIYSTIPIALPKPETIDSPDETSPMTPEPEAGGEPVPVEITWRGGGQTVVMARAGDDEWQGRQPMEQDTDEPTTFRATVFLLPGTHHLRFLVDEQWRVADDMPTAVDDQGTLANYVAVTAPVVATTPTPTLTLPSVRVTQANTAPALPRVQPQTGPSFWSSNSDDSSSSYPSRYHHHHPAQQTSPSASASHKPPPAAVWTDVIPLELIEAAREEEAYLAASSATHQTGFIPAPNIPPAPALPRHLDRLILNGRSPGVGVIGGRRDGRTTPGAASSHSGSGGRRERDRDRDGRKEREKDRDGKEKEGRERDRDGGRERSTRRRDRERERERDRDSTPTAHTTMPSVPQVPTSAQAFSSGAAPSTETPTRVPLPPSPNPDAAAASSSNANGTLAPTSSSTQPSATTPTPAPSTALPMHLDPFQDGPGLADDTSVLPVPSHVVLQHLSTSAIRNGVLAVGTTNRYRKKFMTVVYYKPT